MNCNLGSILPLLLILFLLGSFNNNNCCDNGGLFGPGNNGCNCC